MIRAVTMALLLAGPAVAQDVGGEVAARLNDYPTSVRADYIFGCMAANGQTRDTLIDCSCSIDEIAGILSYEDYVAAETVLSMRQTGGERFAVFNSAPQATSVIAELRRAQAEAEIICF